MTYLVYNVIYFLVASLYGIPTGVYILLEAKNVEELTQCITLFTIVCASLVSHILLLTHKSKVVSLFNEVETVLTHSK